MYAFLDCTNEIFPIELLNPDEIFGTVEKNGRKMLRFKCFGCGQEHASEVLGVRKPNKWWEV